MSSKKMNDLIRQKLKIVPNLLKLFTKENQLLLTFFTKNSPLKEYQITRRKGRY